MSQFENYWIEIRKSKFGKGLFAKTKIAAGTILCKAEGREINFEETLKLNDKESHAFQFDFDRYIICESTLLYFNHLCYSYCGIIVYLEMITIRDIQKGEELFWDYSTTMLERHWTMKCSCGEKNCRKIITDFDFLPVKLQSKYIGLNIVHPFIVNFLQQQLGKSA